MIVCYKIEFFGTVQEVGFRMMCCTIARTYNINGTARNRVDGAVEVICEGSDYNIALFIAECEKGNGYSEVISITKTIYAKQHFVAFRVVF